MTKRADVLVASIALAGALLRIALAYQMYPWTGDPTFSYCYRALLLADGQWQALFMLWHLPGYPLLLALLLKAGGNLVGPYVLGTGVSVLSYLLLVFVVDRLVAPRAQSWWTRLVVASFLALYETLFYYATGPLSEPPYLLLLYSAVWIIDRERVSVMRALSAGLLLGAATTMRLEGVAPLLGMAVWLAVRGFTESGSIFAAIRLAACTLLGWTIAFGWLLCFPSYLEACRQSQQMAYTIPPVQGVMANAIRLAECAYHACTVWLPFALLLPYWLVLGIGLTHPARAPGRAPLQGLLLAVILPSLLLVGASIMHKRTCSFLLPAAGIWFGLGIEVIGSRLGADRFRFGTAVLASAAIAFNVAQASRVLYNLRHEARDREPASLVAARLLEEHGEVGPVYSFGSESEVYSFWRKPIYITIWEKDKRRPRPSYEKNRGAPDQFIEELRSKGIQYLSFVLATHPGTDRETASQRYCWDGEPLRKDLDALVENPSKFGLELIGMRPIEHETNRVYLFKILRR